MAIYKFRQIYKSMQQVIGDEKAEELFKEYKTLDDKMPIEEQEKLASKLMDRLDNTFDKQTVLKIRRKHPCNVSKTQIKVITDIKNKYSNLKDRIEHYSEYLNPGFCILKDNQLIISFGLKKCVCGLFRKLDNYEPISPSWCECCNAHTMKMFKMLCDKEFELEIIETYACGGNDCIFKGNI